MNKILLYIIAIISINFGNVDSIVEAKLNDIDSMPYVPEYSGDSVFWELVIMGKDAIPSLINKIVDTTLTEIIVPNCGGFYRIGDISYIVIMEIIRSIPTFELAQIPKKEVKSRGFCTYWEFIRKGFNNRKLFQINVNDWCLINKDNLLWIKDTLEFRGGTHNYPRKNPANGYYKIKNKN